MRCKSRPPRWTGLISRAVPRRCWSNNTLWSGKDENGNVRPDFTPTTVGGITTGYSELPKEGETEIWEMPVSSAAADLHYPFDPSGGFQHGYVWHCLIIDHEDNGMKRPDIVQLNPAAPAPADRPLRKGIDY